jgi:hypothetical protein
MKTGIGMLGEFLQLVVVEVFQQPLQLFQVINFLLEIFHPLRLANTTHVNLHHEAHVAVRINLSAAKIAEIPDHAPAPCCSKLINLPRER